MTKQKTPTRSAKRRAWSYKVGEKGRNRVRVFAWQEQGEGLWIDYREAGKRFRKPLGHSDQQRAKREADEIALRLGAGSTRPAVVESLTLRTLFDKYLEERTAHKKSAHHDQRTIKLFLVAFGPNRKPESLDVRDWDSYIRRRRSGELAPPPRRKNAKVKRTPVRARVVEQDLKLLLAILNWAERRRCEDGSASLLDRNPLRGLKVPKEESPRRPMFSLEQCVTLRRVAAEQSSLAERFVMVAYYTGHRSNSIRLLRWSDIDLEHGTIRWRAESDKIGYEHWTPMHAELIATLKAARVREKAIGDAWVFPHPHNATRPMSREYLVKKLWPALRKGAGIPQGEHYGWHSFRRTFANQLRSAPLKDQQVAGGWKSAQTLVQVYHQPDVEAVRATLARLASNGQ